MAALSFVSDDLAIIRHRAKLVRSLIATHPGLAFLSFFSFAARAARAQTDASGPRFIAVVPGWADAIHAGTGFARLEPVAGGTGDGTRARRTEPDASAVHPR